MKGRTSHFFSRRTGSMMPSPQTSTSPQAVFDTIHEGLDHYYYFVFVPKKKKMQGAAVKAPAVKILLVGDVFTGKSSIVERVCRDRVHPQMESTIGFDFRSIDYKAVTYNFWDASGMERFRCILPNYFRGVSMVWIVVDASTPEAASQARYWATECRKYTDRPLILIANKSDLPNAGHEWPRLAVELDIPYVLASAKSNNQHDWFAKLLPFMKQQSIMPPPPPNICLGRGRHHTNECDVSCCS